MVVAVPAGQCPTSATASVLPLAWPPDCRRGLLLSPRHLGLTPGSAIEQPCAPHNLPLLFAKIG